MVGASSQTRARPRVRDIVLDLRGQDINWYHQVYLSLSI